jgi:hypothetical protein
VPVIFAGVHRLLARRRARTGSQGGAAAALQET